MKWYTDACWCFVNGWLCDIRRSQAHRGFEWEVRLNGIVIAQGLVRDDDDMHATQQQMLDRTKREAAKAARTVPRLAAVLTPCGPQVGEEVRS